MTITIRESYKWSDPTFTDPPEHQAGQRRVFRGRLRPFWLAIHIRGAACHLRLHGCAGRALKFKCNASQVARRQPCADCPPTVPNKPAKRAGSVAGCGCARGVKRYDLTPWQCTIQPVWTFQNLSFDRTAGQHRLTVADKANWSDLDSFGIGRRRA